MFKKKTEVDYSKLLEDLGKNSWVILYKKYSSMNPYDYQRLLDEWDMYYRIVREDSPTYKLYIESKNAWTKKDFETVKKNAVIAKEWLLNGKRIPSPSEEDPRVIERRSPVQTYQSIKNLHNPSSNFSI